VLLNSASLKPIYLQIAEWLEDEILSGHLREDERVYSQYQLAEIFNVNPATAGKSLALLAEKGIIYKKRGLGMFTALNAAEKIRSSRTESLLQQMVNDLVWEAKKLNVDKERLIAMIRQAASQLGEEDGEKEETEH